MGVNVIKKSYIDKLRYKFDNFMSKGTGALIAALTAITTGLIFIVSLILWLTKSSPENSFLQLLWMSLMRAMDAGALGGDSGSFGFMLLMLLITIGGIFVLSILIGLLTTGIEAKVESLRKGRSVVLEKDHTIILGWSDQIFTIISELIVANSNRKRPCIVIMGDKDKVEMDDEIREKIDFKGNTRIICRQGSPMEMSDLNIVSLNTSRSIIIIEESDSDVIKIILAITHNPKRRELPYNITAVLKNAQNVEVANIAGKGEVEIILVDKLISRLIAQTCRQPGLSSIYTELLDFGGDEIYFTEEEALTGKTFGEALLMYENSCIMGICDSKGTIINPPMNTVIQKGDKIIAISEDDDTVKLSGLKDYSINEQAIVNSNKEPIKQVESTLILGWNEKAVNIIEEIDSYVIPNSLVTVVCDFPGSKEILDKTALGLKNQRIELLIADVKDRNTLNELVVKNYTHIIVLSNSSYTDIQQADSSTLITLLQLRDISEKMGVKFSVVSEMLDIRNRQLAEITKVNDFIVSVKIISLMLTQVSENRHLNDVFEDLFDSDGSEIYIKPVSDYIAIGDKVNFYTMIEAARKKNEIAIGYKVVAEESDSSKGYGIYINPKKPDMIKTSLGDGIILISQG
jgi:ion channel POLLUX/CASTOR